MLKLFVPILTILYFSVIPFIHAQTFENLLQDCIFETIKTTDKSRTLQQIEEYCDKKIIKKEFKKLFFLGAMGCGVCGAFPFLAGETTTVTNMGIIYTSSPIFIILISAFFPDSILSPFFNP